MILCVYVIENWGTVKGKFPAHLNHCQPDFLKNGLCDILLHALNGLTVEIPRLRCQLGQQSRFLLVLDLLLQEDLLCLSKHNMYQALDRLSA